MQSRYYNPATGRFLNADSYASTGQGIIGNNMFAYCGNNPVANYDPSGCRYVARSDDVSNVPPYIIDQERADIGRKIFGLANVAHGGCGIVASYNALLSMGESQSFDDVLAYYRRNVSSVLGYGLMGLLPHDIAGFFTNRGYIVQVSNQKSQIEAFSQSADACIMYYEFPRTYHFLNIIPVDAYGAHFVEYSRTYNGYLGRNTSEGNGTYLFVSPFEYGMKDLRYYMVGIFIYK